MSINRRQFLQTLTALLGLPAISAVAAPDKELAGWVRKEEEADPDFLVAPPDINFTLYARLFKQTFILNGDLVLETSQETRTEMGLGRFVDVIRPICRTLTISSSDRNFHKTIEKLSESEWNYVEIGFLSADGSPKKLIDLHGVRLIEVSTTVGTELPSAGALGLGMTYASLSYRIAKVDATKFAELAKL